jgi:chromosome segregation ATPase
MQHASQNTFPSNASNNFTNPSNQIELSDNEDINYQINTTISKLNNNQNNINIDEYNYQNSDPNNNNNNNLITKVEQLNQEKQSLMNTLRKEMIINEEQRNYINILKETIESNLFKNGFADIIQKSSPNTTNLADAFVNIAQMQNEVEKSKKDLIHLNNQFNDAKTEIKTLKKQCEDLTASNALLNQTVDKYKINHNIQEQNKEQSEKNIQGITLALNTLRNQNNALKNQITEYQTINKSHEKQLQSNYNQINQLTDTVNKYKSIENDYARLSSEFDKTKYQVLNLQKQNCELENELQTQQNESLRLNKSLRNLHNEHQQTLEQLTKVRRECDSMLFEKDCIDKVKQRYQNSQSQLEDAFEKINELLTIKEKNEHLLTEYSSMINELKRDNEKYQYIVSKSQNENALLNKQCDELQNDKKILSEKLFEVSEEHNNILVLNQENEMNINKIIAEKASIDNERRYWKEKYQDEVEVQKMEYGKLNGKFHALQQQNEALVEEIGNLKKNIQELQMHLKEKEQINENIINENKDLQTKLEQNQLQLQEAKNEITKYLNLKDKNNQLQLELNALSEEMAKLKEQNVQLQNELTHSINEMSNIQTQALQILGEFMHSHKIKDNINASPQFKKFFEDFEKHPENKNSPQLIEQYIINFSRELVTIYNTINSLQNELKQTNIKLFDTEQERLSQIKTIQSMKAELEALTFKQNTLINDKANLQDQLSYSKGLIEQLKNTCDNYSNEMNNKNQEIINVNHQLNLLQDENTKNKNDKNYLESILLRVCKMFPNSNLYKLVHEILNVYQSNEDKDKLNNALLIELQRVEEYLKVIKESSLEANYLNKQLTRHLQDANEEIVRNRNMATQGINNSMRDYDYSHNRTWRTNTGNGFMQYEK